MKKISVLILIFLFLGNLALFSQDGEEIDFLEKVTEPKKTVSKKSSNTAGTSSGTSTPKKKEKKRSKKKRSKKSSSSLPNNLEETQKKNINHNETSSGNVDEQRTSASKIDLKDLPKPYWVNEEVKIHPNNLPGYTVSQKSEQGSSFGSELSEILKLGEDKKKEENKKKVQEVQKSGSFTGFLSEYKKPIIIIVFILLFALYRLKAGKSRGSSSRKSPVTINKMRRD
ncbi:SRP-less Sec system protein [Leptospira kirschneri]|uniref:SRP-less Sec system protein n=1 Tax=Leptospira kirschneri TaxID=29507 RepID=UPI0002984D2F|nr:SRP-less Sec system protein [Leptospira kirschneri]EKR10508.1 hypothetical protein LEP1GSC122_3993 [Leptospira kirschneri serovar Valbuzzi str. 200702274]